MRFHLRSKLKPTGDQPQAIEKLAANLKSGAKHQTLLGVTGSGKTFTMANVIEKIQKPTLVISHNKTLAAQLYQEFREFFPKNAVHYFVSYYDYYQPEAYIPQTDTYIDKDAQVNEKIDQLRHAATQDLITRKDVIVVASVSCIYNIGSPLEYQNLSLSLKNGQKISRRDLIKYLLSLLYQRNDMEPKHGTFSARGENVEIRPAKGNEIIRVEMDGDKISRIYTSQICTNPPQIPQIINFTNNMNKNNAAIREISGKFAGIREIKIFPAQYWATPKDNLSIAVENIKTELGERLNQLKKQNKLLEAQRLEQKTLYDIEMMKEIGWCHGIENYSRHLDFRKTGEPPYTLFDYFSFADPSYIAFIDESHMAIPQIKAMHAGDKARKEVLIRHGFRLPSTLDNRPLKFKEFEKKINQVIYVSATPSDYELRISNQESRKHPQINPPLQRERGNGRGSGLIAQQLIRPTGLLDPKIEIRPTKGQIAHLIKEIKKRAKNGQRILVTTLTKRLAENLSDFLKDKGIKACYLHSEINTLERPDILRNLRLGKYDVLVGINLLREGLDLPEVSLVVIFDADKEGFLRNKTTLIQTMGRAARHPEGHIIMYADNITGSMKEAIRETQRRRKIQEEYNKKYGIAPKAIRKEIRGDIIPANDSWQNSQPPISNFQKMNLLKSANGSLIDSRPNIRSNSLKIRSVISDLNKEMKKAAKNFDFGKAAFLRDEIEGIKNPKKS